MKWVNLAFVIVLSFWGMWSGDWLREKWVPICLFGMFIFLRPLWKIDKLLSITIFYTLANGIWIGLFQSSYIYEFDYKAQQILTAEILKGCIYLISLVLIVYKWERVKEIKDYLWILCLGATAWQTMAFLMGWHLKGISFNKSLSCTAVALLYPFLLKQFSEFRFYNFIFWLFPISSAILLDSSISLFAMMATLFSYVVLVKLNSYNLDLKKILIGPEVITCFFILILSLAIAFHFMGDHLFSFNKRLEFWESTLYMFWENPEKWVMGFGIGTFYSWGPVIVQHIQGLLENIFITAHNDWIQALFELGALGMILWIAIFLKALYRSLKTPWAASFFVALFFTSFGNSPHHLGLEAFLIAYMYSMVFSDQSFSG